MNSQLLTDRFCQILARILRRILADREENR